MQDWINSNECANFRAQISQGCTEGDIVILHIPLPLGFLCEALKYTSRKYNKKKMNRYYYSNHAQPYRISVVCDGNSIYMSFANLNTGLSANIYSADIVNAPVFNVVIPEIKISINPHYSSTNNAEFSIVISPEIFGIVSGLANVWHDGVHAYGANQGTINAIFSGNVIGARRLPSECGAYWLALCAYTGNRPFIATKASGTEPDFIEYRRTKTVSIHYGVEGPLLDQINPESIVGIKPSHARWLLNKASKTSGNVKGELIAHFTENSPMFVGVSPGSSDFVMDYEAHGKGGARGKYREYSCNKETQCTIPRDSIATKFLSLMVLNSDIVYFGTTNTSTVLGCKKNNSMILWEHTFETCDEIHPELNRLKSMATIDNLKCGAFVLPTVLNRVKLPSFFVGYSESEEEDLTEDEAKILMRWWNDHVNSEILAGRVPTKESKELFERIKKLC